MWRYWPLSGIEVPKGFIKKINLLRTLNKKVYDDLDEFSLIKSLVNPNFP